MRDEERFDDDWVDEEHADIGDLAPVVFLRLEWNDLDVPEAIFATDFGDSIALDAEGVRRRIAYLSEQDADVREERKALSALEQARPDY